MALNACFALVDIIHCISYIFKDKKFEIKRTSLRTNPCTHFASLKNIHLFFSKLSWRSFFILFIFHSKFHFVDIFFSNSSHCKVKNLCYKIWSQLYMSLYILRLHLGFKLIMMFVCRGRAGLSGCRGEWVHMQSVGEERNAHRNFFLC